MKYIYLIIIVIILALAYFSQQSFAQNYMSGLFASFLEQEKTYQAKASAWLGSFLAKDEPAGGPAHRSLGEGGEGIKRGEPEDTSIFENSFLKK